jgi:hypothetical protein
MANFKLLSGPFIGEVVEDGQIIPHRFSELDEDMQDRVRDFAEEKYPSLDPGSEYPESLDDLAEEYENSWDSEETDEPVTMNPLF